LVFAYRVSNRFFLKFKWSGDFCKVYFSFVWTGKLLKMKVRFRYEFLNKRSRVLYQQIKWLLYFLTKMKRYLEVLVMNII
jgi:hypothetical protein